MITIQSRLREQLSLLYLLPDFKTYNINKQIENLWVDGKLQSRDTFSKVFRHKNENVSFTFSFREMYDIENAYMMVTWKSGNTYENYYHDFKSLRTALNQFNYDLNLTTGTLNDIHKRFTECFNNGLCKETIVQNALKSTNSNLNSHYKPIRDELRKLSEFMEV